MYKLVETKEDIRKISKMAGNIWHEAYKDMISLDQIDYMLDKFLSIKAIKEQINEHYDYFILRGEKPAGFAAILHKDNEVFISKLYVYKDDRGKGLTTLFIDYTKSFKKPMYLTVNKTNLKAVKLYERLGFKITESVVSDIGSGYVMDDYVLRYEHDNL
ncbi:MAG TPA: GNAT family N-acetyltransferase [Acholeplasma sp.]|nr:GNAT family N-acetyltransferase [Acholeplasma sp.]